MRICLFGAASPRIHETYIKETEELGERLAQRGHDLVYGAGANGVMGAAARGFHKGGGKVYGVVPKFFREENIEALYEQCDELIYTETMAERKFKMEEMAEAFIIAPGGIGTFEEFFEVLTLKQLGRHEKPIVLFDICGYYMGMLATMRSGVAEGFLTQEVLRIMRVFHEKEDDLIIDYLEGGSDRGDYTVHDLWLGWDNDMGKPAPGRLKEG